MMNTGIRDKLDMAKIAPQFVAELVSAKERSASDTVYRCGSFK